VWMWGQWTNPAAVLDGWCPPNGGGIRIGPGNTPSLTIWSGLQAGMGGCLFAVRCYGFRQLQAALARCAPENNDWQPGAGMIQTPSAFNWSGLNVSKQELEFEI